MTDENNKNGDVAKADAAPYIKRNNDASSHSGSGQQGSTSTWLILLIAAALILLTIYKFNEERSAPPAQTETQEDIVETEIIVIETMPAAPASDEAETQATGTAEQFMPPAEENAQDQPTEETMTEARAEAQQRMSNNQETMQLRRQQYEQELQKKKQEFDAIIKAHIKERDTYIAKRKEEFERLKQERIEAREKIQEIQKQIYVLHEKIRQIMMESRSQPES